ncbi:MAG TPA: 2-phospho-L-lactate transferase [Candidatus Acidoferrales bacterium]|nr:2-phospho-L-lactate transferase [Candidatus Acidoferrales bacterium]
MKITALAGGVGASKLLRGLARAGIERDLTVIVNTGDDIVLHGLRISPDLDIVTYTLAGVVNSTTGWGFRGDTFAALERLRALGREAWFHLGDRDLATHLHRTAMMASGASLSEAADSIRQTLGVKSRILPMSDRPVPTYLETNEGLLHFQEYLVKRRAEPVVRGIRFTGIEKAAPAPGVIEAIEQADAVLVCPSNPLISIGPILGVPGIREALVQRRTDVFAVSPLVGGKSLKGPSDKMLAQLGHEASASGVAKLYSDFSGTYIIDPADKREASAIEALGMRVEVRPTVMRTEAQKIRLARSILKMVSQRKKAAGA